MEYSNPMLQREGGAIWDTPILQLFAAGKGILLGRSESPAEEGMNE